MDKISVIVPIYNVRNYLEDCIESIIHQTYQNLEIILIVDGSKDNSLSICEKYKNIDDRIKVIQTVNLGIGPTRNLGIDIATGKYLTFIDGDDTVAIDLISHLYDQLLKDDSDIAVCNFYRLNDQGIFSFPIDKNNSAQKAEEGCYSPKMYLNKEAMPNDVIRDTIYPPWGKLYKKFLFQNIEYPNVSGEDNFTTWKLLLSANKISYVHYDDYCWKERAHSITNRPNLQLAMTNVLAMQERIQFYSLLKIHTQYIRSTFPVVLQHLINDATNCGNKIVNKNSQATMDILTKYNN